MRGSLIDSSSEGYSADMSIDSATIYTHPQFFTEPNELKECVLYASQFEDTQVDDSDSDSDNTDSSTDQIDMLTFPTGAITGEYIATRRYKETGTNVLNREKVAKCLTIVTTKLMTSQK
jgi:hypothetical protein